MRIIFRNFLVTLNRFRLSSALNILSLTLAYATFMLIMFQIRYEYGYGKDQPDYRRIYRLEEKESWSYSSKNSINLPSEFIESFVASTPGIEAYARLLYMTTDVLVKREGESRLYKDIPSVWVQNDISDVFYFDMVAGTVSDIVRPGAVMISESLARRFFGNDDPVGKVVSMGKEYTVCAVFRDFPGNSALTNGLYALSSNYYFNTLFIRISRHVSPDDMLAAYLKNRQNDPGSDKALLLELVPLADTYFKNNDVDNSFVPKGNRSTTKALFSVAILIILIAVINFVNFSTALAPVRMKSLNTRLVMGQGVGSLRRMLVAEALGCSLIAYLLSVGLAAFLESTPLIHLLKTSDPGLVANRSVVWATAGVAFVTGLLAGLYPAFFATGFSPTLVLKGSFGLSKKGRNLRFLLVGFQFTVSMVLIAMAVAIGLQNRFIRDIPTGYDSRNVLYVRWTDEGMDVVKEKLRALPFVTDIAEYNGSFGMYDADFLMNIVTLDRDTFALNGYFVDHNFLKLMSLPVEEGRDFLPDDQAYFTRKDGNFTVQKIILNRAAARMFGVGVDSLIRRQEETLQVIGVTGNYISRALYDGVAPSAFILNDTNGRILLKIAGSDPAAEIAAVKNTLREIQPVESWEVGFFDEEIGQLYAKERDLGLLIILFSLLAVCISLAGVFGLVVFETQYREKEIGLRKVFGSTTAQILGLFGKVYIRILVVCFAVATPVIYYVVTSWLANFSYRIPVYWWIFALTFLTVCLITLMTVTFQNWRAANVNPVKSIKTE